MRTVIARVELLSTAHGERYLGAVYRETPEGLHELSVGASATSIKGAVAHVVRALPSFVADAEAIVVDGMTFTRAAWRAAVNHLANVPPHRRSDERCLVAAGTLASR